MMTGADAGLKLSMLMRSESIKREFPAAAFIEEPDWSPDGNILHLYLLWGFFLTGKKMEFSRISVSSPAVWQLIPDARNTPDFTQRARTLRLQLLPHFPRRRGSSPFSTNISRNQFSWLKNGELGSSLVPELPEHVTVSCGGGAKDPKPASMRQPVPPIRDLQYLAPPLRNSKESKKFCPQ